jgi:hypothetical protein
MVSYQYSATRIHAVCQALDNPRPKWGYRSRVLVEVYKLQRIAPFSAAIRLSNNLQPTLLTSSSIVIILPLCQLYRLTPCKAEFQSLCFSPLNITVYHTTSYSGPCVVHGANRPRIVLFSLSSLSSIVSLDSTRTRRCW